jgi:hypothetical protein
LAQNRREKQKGRIAPARNTMAQKARNMTARALSTKAQRAQNRNGRELKPTGLPLKVQAGSPAPNRTELAAKEARLRWDWRMAPVAKPSAAAVSKDGW